MKIVVDYELCEANAVCVGCCPEAFRVEDDDTLVDVAVGDVYYVQGEILWGFPAGRPKFSQQPEPQALADIQGL